MREHLMIPDMQVKPGVPTDHLEWVGEYILEKRPDAIINIGDFWDYPSLSSYDFGKKAAEGRRVCEDTEAGCLAMERLMKPLKRYNAMRERNKKKQYKPDMHFTEGNHEERVRRAAEVDAKIDGLLPNMETIIKAYGWEFHPFLKPVELDGVSYAHYFYNPKTGRPYGGESIITRLKNIGFTFSMGHQQGYHSGMRELNNGATIRGLIAGSGYLHDEDYIGHQGNGHWRGIIYKHEVFGGNYDLMEVSLDYLCRKYEGVPVSEYMQKKHPEVFNQSVWLQRLEARRQAIGMAT